MRTVNAKPHRAILALILGTGLVSAESTLAQPRYYPGNVPPQVFQYQPYIPNYVSPNAGATQMWPNRVVPLQPGYQPLWNGAPSYGPPMYLDPRSMPAPVQQSPRYVWRIYR